MMKKLEDVNMQGKAPLTNIGLTLSAFYAAINRPAHLPGIVVLYGPSGLGKTTAASVAQTQLNAYYLEVHERWSAKSVYMAILKVMGIVPARTVYELEDQVATQLATSRRPLILDECHYLIKKGTIDIVRDLYEMSGAAIMLIGEEHFPAALSRWERIHNRVLEWVPAQYADMNDARALRDLYCDRVRVEDDLLEKIHAVSKGVTRRICVNIERAQQAGLENGKSTINLAEWGSRRFDTGEAPIRGAR